ncbi:hypothetical protein [Streptacidiphilus rugosus]|uniref:hypothetical protein n=1 Tax=Streptacidiphilus rugosus TaxID=405783 RepID=UPI00055D0C81|nr:hypothetical protein [Streptacidiphilus rugosus]
MRSWASNDNPGIYVYAPFNPWARWNSGAPSSLPRAHYVCRCGQTRAVIGAMEVQALIREYLDHMATAHADVPAAQQRQSGRRAA